MLRIFILFILIFLPVTVIACDYVNPECAACENSGNSSSMSLCTVVSAPTTFCSWTGVCTTTPGVTNWERRYFSTYIWTTSVTIPRANWSMFPTSGSYPNDRYFKNMELPLGPNMGLGGKGHTVYIPGSLNCYPSTATGGMVCNNYTLGEAFGHAVEARMKVYAPNGRIIWMKVRQGMGRY